MSFVALIVRSLFRQRTRTLLTVVGIAVGISTVVALGAVTGGIEQTSGEIIHTGGADFMVAQKGASDFSFSTVREDEWDRLEGLAGVEQAIGVLFHFTSVPGNPLFPEMGVRPDQLASVIGTPAAGRLPAGPDEVALGVRAARNLDVAVGEVVAIGRDRLRVVGLFEAEGTFESSGAYLPLATVQRIAAKPGVVSAVYVAVKPGTDPVALARRIEREEPTLATIATVSEYGKVDQGMTLLHAIELAISLLAVGIGAVGVTNTMIMSVFERTREIGILRAVGWSRRRILSTVLGEGIALCLVAALVGVGLGVAAAEALMLVPSISNFLAPVYTAELFARAAAIGIGVGLLGAAYPAVRAIRLTPMEALRHE